MSFNLYDSVLAAVVNTWPYDGREPEVGDSVVARRPLRSWINDDERGFYDEGLLITKGQIGLVLRRENVGKTLRLKLLINNRIALFACHTENVTLNWKIVSEIP